jgi:hypothetical protein
MYEDQPARLPTHLPPYAAGSWVAYRDSGVAVEVLMDLGEGLLRVRTDTSSERTIRTHEVRPATEAEQRAATERRAQALAQRDHDRGLRARAHA